jgi:DNA-binding MarR family transcriptional regulator
MARPPAAHEFEQAAELRRALQEFLRQSERVTRRHGLTNERYQLLLLIRTSSREEAPTVGDLAAALHLSKSTITQLVRRAQNLGLVRRELSERDARIRYLRLTAEGERRLNAAVLELRDERHKLVELARRLDA